MGAQTSVCAGFLWPWPNCCISNRIFFSILKILLHIGGGLDTEQRSKLAANQRSGAAHALRPGAGGITRANPPPRTPAPSPAAWRGHP